MKRLFAPLILLFLSCRPSGPQVIMPEALNSPQSAQIAEQPPRYGLSLLAAGDNLLHDTILASQSVGETYNFAPVYAEVKSLIEKADIAFVNQETVMAGKEYGYSDYPRFNTPQELAATLAETGFDIVNHANNHVMDMEEAGLAATIKLWETIPGITLLGIQNSEVKHRIIVKNNIRLGFLAYTYDLNGFVLPKEKPWLVSLIHRRIMAEDIDALRPLCDFLIVSMHWGDEYQTVPSSAQISLASFLAEHNVDLVIGHHPHVLQRFESLPRPDGRQTLCYYSLGNFVSHQREKEKILGAFLYAQFEKTGDALSISTHGLVPLVCHFDRNLANTKVFPLYSYSEELLEKHWSRLRDTSLNMEYFNSALNALQANLFMYDPLLKINNLALKGRGMLFL